MRVMCICDKWNPAAEAVNSPRPNIGDIDIVIGEKEYFGDKFYELERFKGNFYMTNMFAVLPEPDADEMMEEEQESIANLQPA